ncbi:hypothetical protein GHT06_022315 [Daphnia sinensis]|uniref:Uncharacterized protein n=1 Tax=Daphnia sinensis TaxID=1820382 RepID=A0AAD5KXW1_9CRUS|nr:hypothetical protein GHT06_022315 [Daphnia sinensis]
MIAFKVLIAVTCIVFALATEEQKEAIEQQAAATDADNSKDLQTAEGTLGLYGGYGGLGYGRLGYAGLGYGNGLYGAGYGGLGYGHGIGYGAGYGGYGAGYGSNYGHNHGSSGYTSINKVISHGSKSHSNGHALGHGHGLYITSNGGSNDIQSRTLDNLPHHKAHRKLIFKSKMIAIKILFGVVCFAVAMASEESQQVPVKDNEDLKTEETHIGGYGLGDGIYGVNQFNNGLYGQGLGFGSYGNGLGLGGYGGIGAGYGGIGAGYGGIGGAYGGIGAGYGGIGAYGAGYGGVGAYGGVGGYGGIGGYGAGYGANHKNAHGHGHNQGHSSYESVNKVSSHQSHNSAAGGHHSAQANHALGGAGY